jgi:hypothetical protein
VPILLALEEIRGGDHRATLVPPLRTLKPRVRVGRWNWSSSRSQRGAYRSFCQQQFQPKDISDVCLCARNWARIFRGGVRFRESATYFSRPTPHRSGSRERLCASTRFPMILAAMNLYPSLTYLVLAISRKAGQLSSLHPDRGGAMQDIGYELRRTPLLEIVL